MYVQVDFIKQELADIKAELQEIKNGVVAPVRLTITVKMAAEMTGVSKSTLYLLMKNKQIKYSSIGGKKVIKIVEVERLINDREIYTKRR